MGSIDTVNSIIVDPIEFRIYSISRELSFLTGSIPTSVSSLQGHQSSSQMHRQRLILMIEHYQDYFSTATPESLKITGEEGGQPHKSLQSKVCSKN